ncbi:MAG TPA: hypothetical protein VFZ69_02175 [Longimicrobiales bacterium]
MRRFRDREGLVWDVVLGRESWGASVALFVPESGRDGVVRQAVLEVPAYDAAMRELDALDEPGLQALLDRSIPKEEGLG